VIGQEQPPVMWEEDHQTRTMAVNLGARYIALAVELLLGLVMLPFNTRHLGASEYGLWMLAASIVSYFPLLDLGYGGSLERFVAHYRARRDASAINEICSTLLFLFTASGVVAMAIVAGIAWNLGSLFGLDPAQARTGGLVMMLVAGQLAVGLPFGVFGAVSNGFQRTHRNAVAGTLVALAVAAVNVAVLLAGGNLVTLVGAMALTRMAGYAAYRINAYHAFPLLRIRPSLVRMSRLREVTGFSVYVLVQDISRRVNYAADPIIIAAVLSTGAVAVWTVAQRLAEVVLQLTNQFNYVLFPIVVDCDTARRDERLKDLLVQGTKLSLATTLPVTGSLAILANAVVVGWTGAGFSAAATVLQMLAMVVVIRVGSQTASTVLMGAGHHRLIAYSNLAAAIANIVLSVVLIRTYGLPGVAFATVVVIGVRACTVLIPIACARVGITLREFVRTAIWPVTWPAVVALVCLMFLRETASVSLAHAVLYGGAISVFYWLLFVGVAISREERNRYLGKLRSIARRPALEAA
jgi:O-antigen/teichoic acid export membrane protein